MSTADERERRRRQAEADFAAEEAGVPRIAKPRETRAPSGKPAKGYLRDRRYQRAPRSDTS